MPHDPHDEEPLPAARGARRPIPEEKRIKKKGPDGKPLPPPPRWPVGRQCFNCAADLLETETEKCPKCGRLLRVD